MLLMTIVGLGATIYDGNWGLAGVLAVGVVVMIYVLRTDRPLP